MKDSKGNNISIGDRVKVLWGYDNRMYSGKIIHAGENLVTIATMNKKISTSDSKKVTKIPINGLVVR